MQATFDRSANSQALTSAQPIAVSFPLTALLAVLAVAAIGRVLLLASGAVTFHSDEGIIALMARHILQGERPVFFYGQAYMGSLDAWLVAVGFALFGESVTSIRIIQSALYLGIVATGFVMAWRLSERVTVATVAGLVLAVPPVLMATYTTATLGGYNETLLLGNLLLILSYDLTHGYQRSWWRWTALGLIAGLGWWTNGLIIAFAMPVGLLLLRYFSPRMIPFYLLAILCFFIGGAPWWIYDFQNNHAAMAFYVSTQRSDNLAGNNVPWLPFPMRVFGLIFLGLPTLLGLRFPWSPESFLVPVGGVVLFVYGVAFYRLLKRYNPLKPDARALLLGMIGLFCALFLVSKFSIDPTGRYFLPLMLPFAIALGALVDGVGVSVANLRRRRILQAAIVGVVLGYNAAGQISVAQRFHAEASQPRDFMRQVSNPGFTTQFNLVSHIPNDWDAELIAFLEDHQLTNGYGSYWVTIRLAFLSQERLQYSASLAYKADLQYDPADNRYWPYRDATAAAADENIAYISATAPEVDEQLEAYFAAEGVTYTREQIGPYRIYYEFEPFVPRPPVPKPPDD